MRSILIITTVGSTINAFLKPHIRVLKKLGYSVDIASNFANIDSRVFTGLVDNVYDIPFKRTLSLKNIIKSVISLNRIKKNNYDIVHTHTPIASALARLVFGSSESKIIYTAHGFHFYEGAPKSNWKTYYPIEKYLAKKTDLLITINKEDYNNATKFPANNLVYIPGVGVNINKYRDISVNKNEVKYNLGIPKDGFIILSVGELNDNKNHSTILKAINELGSYNSDIYYIICGKGPNKEALIREAKKLGLENNLFLLGFRNDLPKIYKIADVFAFPSKREGLGLSAIEAMASGLPLLTSDVHGINDYSENYKTGFKYSPNDYQGFADGIKKLKGNTKLRKQIGEYNRNLAEKYELSFILKTMEKIYLSFKGEPNGSN